MNTHPDLTDATWPDAYVAIREAAIEGRGTVERDIGGETLRWPKTTGDDVIAISAVVDPHVRELPEGFGQQAIARRWKTALDALAADAMNALGSTYTGSEAFWNTLESVVVYLDATSADLPDGELLEALVDQLATPTPRNASAPADGPFKHFDNVHSYDELYVAQLLYLKNLRGFDNLAPDDNPTAAPRIVPRSTNADVVALADYWSPRFAGIRQVSGHERVESGWKAVLVDVAALARKGDPNAAYSKNNAFWRALQRVAIQMAAIAELPTSTDLALDAFKDSVMHLPDTLKSAGASVVHAAEDAAKSAAKGVLSPIVVGAAAVTGLWLLLRNREHGAEG